MTVKIGACPSCGKAHDLKVELLNREAQYSDILGGWSVCRLGQGECPDTHEPIYLVASLG